MLLHTVVAKMLPCTKMKPTCRSLPTRPEKTKMTMQQPTQKSGRTKTLNNFHTKKLRWTSFHAENFTFRNFINFTWNSRSSKCAKFLATTNRRSVFISRVFCTLCLYRFQNFNQHSAPKPGKLSDELSK